MYEDYKLCVVVPAYNEEDLITETLKDIPDYVDRVYVIDDASTDSTPEIVKTYVNGQITLLSNDCNMGVGCSITTGYKKALEEGMDVMVVMAGDNQMDSKYLPELLEPIIRGEADYTKGDRLSKPGYQKGMSRWRLFGNWILTLLTKIASGYWQVNDPQNGYTVITRKALQKIDLDDIYPRYGYPNDMLVRLNVADCRVCDVPVPAKYGNEKSKIQYGTFIFKVSFLLLRNFLWRIRCKYFIRNRQVAV